MSTQIKIYSTTDVHGCLGRPQSPADSSILRVKQHIDAASAEWPADARIILDAGDFLSGGPLTYYNLFTRQGDAMWPAEVAASVGYDAMAPGNHDLEFHWGRLETFASNAGITLVGANEPSVSPYCIITRNGLRVAVIGMAMPPYCRPLDDPMPYVEDAMRMVKADGYIDAVVGLFHLSPDDSARIVDQIEGFDVVFCGHDHNDSCVRIVSGKVPVINPGPRANAVAESCIVKNDSGRVEVVKPRIVRFDDSVAEGAWPELPDGFNAWMDKTFADFPHTMRLDALLSRALMKAVKADAVKAPESDVCLEGLQRVADTFKWMPYEDFAVSVRTGDGRMIATTPYLAATLFPGAPICEVSPLPLRHYLLNYNL